MKMECKFGNRMFNKIKYMKLVNCVKSVLIGLVLVLGLSSCRVNKTTVYVPEKIANLINTNDSLSISDDRFLVLESIMKTREFKKYVKTLRRVDKKMKPYISNLDKKEVDNLRKNVADTDYVSVFMKKLESQTNIEKEERASKDALNKLLDIMKEKKLTVLEETLLLINAGRNSSD